MIVRGDEIVMSALMGTHDREFKGKMKCFVSTIDCESCIRSALL